MKLRKELAKLFVPGLILALSIGCGSDESTQNPEPMEELPPPDATLISTEELQSAIAAAPPEADRNNEALSVLERSQVGPLTAEQTGGRDLATAAIGLSVEISADVHGDPSPEDVFLFTPNEAVNPDGITYLLWSQGERCHLSWVESGVTWFLFSTCGGDPESGVFICRDDSCTRCLPDENEESGSACHGCTVDGSDVRCPLPEPEPDVPDEPDIPDEPDMEAEPDTVDPSQEGTCDETCLAQEGAVCCTSCGCDGAVACRPRCGSGYTWDCEIGCCFNYDSLECKCDDGESWNSETYQCRPIDG